MFEIIFFILGAMLIVAGIVSLRTFFKRGSELGDLGAVFFGAGLLSLVVGIVSITYFL